MAIEIIKPKHNVRNSPNPSYPKRETVCHLPQGQGLLSHDHFLAKSLLLGDCEAS